MGGGGRDAPEMTDAESEREMPECMESASLARVVSPQVEQVWELTDWVREVEELGSWLLEEVVSLLLLGSPPRRPTSNHPYSDCRWEALLW